MGRGRQRVMGRGRVGMGVRDGEVLGAAGGYWWVLVLPTWVLVLPKPGKTPPKKKKTKHLPLPASPSHPQTSPRSPAQHFPVPPGALSQFLIHFWSRRAGRKPREGLPSPKRARRASRQTGSQHGLSQFLPASATLFVPRVCFFIFPGEVFLKLGAPS